MWRKSQRCEKPLGILNQTLIRSHLNLWVEPRDIGDEGLNIYSLLLLRLTPWREKRRKSRFFLSEIFDKLWYTRWFVSSSRSWDFCGRGFWAVQCMHSLDSLQKHFHKNETLLHSHMSFSTVQTVYGNSDNFFRIWGIPTMSLSGYAFTHVSLLASPSLL